MALIKKYLPNKDYSKIDNKVATIDRGSVCDGAKVLYLYLAGFKNARRITDNYVLSVLNISENTLVKYKKQLKDADLILIDHIAGREYDMYIGSTQFPASKVKEYWDTLESEEAKQKPLTLEDLKRLRGEI